MKMDKLRDKICKEIQRLDVELKQADTDFVVAKVNLQAKQEEYRKLQGALKALDGQEPQTAAINGWESHPTTHTMPLPVSQVANIPLSGNNNKVVIDGIEYEIEEGFEIGKNSFGETAIVKKGVSMPAMSEPSKPIKVTDLISSPGRAVSTEQAFDNPEDLL